MNEVGSGLRALVRKWESVQVELHGSYSIERLNSMQTYCGSSSRWRLFVVLSTMPLLSLVCVAIVDALPMNPPDLGLAQSGTVWARGILVGLFASFAQSLMFCLYVPDLRVSRSTLLFTAIVVTGVSHMVVYCLVLLWWYPLPCTLLWMFGPWIGTLALSLKVARGNFLRKHAQVRKEVRRFTTIWLMQGATVVVYPVFDIIFQSVSDDWKTVAALSVQVFKISERNLFCRYLRGKDDLKPELIIFSVEISNAFFISTSMQQASSLRTSSLLILIDSVQMLLSLFDLILMLKSVKGITGKMGIDDSKIIASAVMIVNKQPSTRQQILLGAHSSTIKPNDLCLSPGQKKKTAAQNGRKEYCKNQVAPDAGMISPSIAPLEIKDQDVGPAPEEFAFQCITPQEQKLLLQKALQILFLTEFLLLREFMEVMTPVLYGGYLSIIFHGPNRQYYPLFDGLDDTGFSKIILNLFLYGLLETGSFVLLVVVVYKTTHKYPLHQLAYTMSSSWKIIQCKLVVWMLLLVQATIPQLGTQNLFKVKWTPNSDQK